MVIDIEKKKKEIEKKKEQMREHDRNSKALRKQIMAEEEQLKKEEAIQEEFNRLKNFAEIGKSAIDIIGFDATVIFNDDSSSEGVTAASDKNEGGEKSLKNSEDLYKEIFQKKIEEFKLKLVNLELRAKFGEIISEVIGRGLEYSDVENFRKYATGIGSPHIKKCMKSEPADTQSQPDSSEDG